MFKTWFGKKALFGAGALALLAAAPMTFAAGTADAAGVNIYLGNGYPVFGYSRGYVWTPPHRHHAPYVREGWNHDWNHHWAHGRYSHSAYWR